MEYMIEKNQLRKLYHGQSMIFVGSEQGQRCPCTHTHIYMNVITDIDRIITF